MNSASLAHPALRVLALTTDAYGGYGGIAQYNRDLLGALNRLPNITFIDILTRLAPLEIAALPQHMRQHRPQRAPAAYAALGFAAAFTKRPDLIFNGHLYHGPLAGALARATGAKLITQIHGIEVWNDVARRHVRALRASDLIVCVSRDSKRRVLDLDATLAQKIFVLPNRVGDDFQPGDRAAARAHFGFKDEKLILSVGRLDSQEGYKGHDRVIELLASLMREHPSLRYVIAGEGSDRARLKDLAQRLNVAERTTFLGRVDALNLPDLYRAADLFALPSAGEGFGIVYLEAMACGVPAIGLKLGGAPDALSDGELGWCVSVEEFPDALRAALRAPAADPHALSRRVHEKFGALPFQRRVGALIDALALA